MPVTGETTALDEVLGRIVAGFEKRVNGMRPTITNFNRLQLQRCQTPKEESHVLTERPIPGIFAATMGIRRIKFVPSFTLTFVLYLLLFSCFALFHAYTNNELSDPQGCQIGLWVQHGQQTLLAALVLVPCVLVLFQLAPNRQSVFPFMALRVPSARAPPAFSFH